MPITLQISHPDRMLIGIVRGTVTPQDLDGFVAEIVAAKALRYRKIIDVMGADRSRWSPTRNSQASPGCLPS
jgi:hypothetical protein